MAIDTSGGDDIGPCQPSALVRYRPILTWLCVFGISGHHWHDISSGGGPQLCTGPGDSSVDGIGTIWGLHVVGEYSILHKHLFRSHRKATSVVSTRYYQAPIFESHSWTIINLILSG